MTRSAILDLLLSVPSPRGDGVVRRRTGERVVLHAGRLLLSASLAALASCSPADGPAAPRTGPQLALADAPHDFEFTPLAFLGDAAPGGGSFINDFEPYGLNNRAQGSFGADLTTGGEGVFIEHEDRISPIARSGDPAPGGGTFGPFFLGRTPINAAGEVTFVYVLQETQPSPGGRNSGLYRFSPDRRVVMPVVVPDHTPAPGGGVFAGVFFDPSLNNEGEIAFAGLVPGAQIHSGPPGIDGSDLGLGVFRADEDGHITNVVSPGDGAPGSATFDLALEPSINDEGDVAFVGHLASESCVPLAPQTEEINCGNHSSYVKRTATGEIRSIAHQGEAAPGGGTYRRVGDPLINNRGQIVFTGDLIPGPAFSNFAVFLQSNGATVPIARPGDPMPGGGNVLRAGGPDRLALNNAGDVSFFARLNTGDNGLYVWSHGVVRLVARTGTVIPGAGTIVALFRVGGPINERGQLLLTAAVSDASGAQRVVLVLATPSSNAA
jgi:hypothetical protein